MGLIKKVTRIYVWNKFGKRCAYCGKRLKYKEMNVDHVIPLYRNRSNKTLRKMGVVRGTNIRKNLYPSCVRCNRWKGTFSVEGFREQIQKQVERLNRSSNQYKMALNYNLIKETGKKVIFWFEKQRKSSKIPKIVNKNF